VVRGSEQKVRGLKWRNMRPDLIVVDDFENDESVMNPDRREKLRNWFMKALLPCGGDDCIVRVVGTILHLDSLLNRLLSNKEWSTAKFQAHGKDFTNILWPEKFTKERLMSIRSNYEAEGDLGGYSQEYLNNPVDEGETYFRHQDFIAMDDPDYEKPMVYVAAADFAISEREKADNTVIMVAGICSEGYLYILDVRRGRIGSIDIIDELISVGRRYDPEIFTFESEKIDKAIKPFLEKEMRRTGVYLNINTVTPSKSKTIRGKSIQSMMKAGVVRFDKKADWYADLETELMTITPAGPKGKHDDQFDAFAYIGLTAHKFNEAPTSQEVEEEEWEDEHFEDIESGICMTTGY
ncbi:MAG: phage terminase large subunit, partial [Halobacteriota archaeon]|nr:phage terminase large subunit [Halobacteriota archaeon]